LLVDKREDNVWHRIMALLRVMSSEQKQRGEWAGDEEVDGEDEDGGEEDG
jgi:hypothetical protein